MLDSNQRLTPGVPITISGATREAQSLADRTKSEDQESIPPDLVCGVDRDLVERFLALIRDNYKKADMAAFFLETRSGIADFQAAANMRDVLSHLTTMLDPESPPNKKSEQLVNAEEHLRRAIVEPYETAINNLLVSFKDLYDVYKAKVLLAKSDYPELAGAPSRDAIELTLSKVTNHYQKGRAAKTINLWTSEWEGGIAHLVEAFDILSTLKGEVEAYWNKFSYLEAQDRRARRRKKNDSVTTAESATNIRVGKFGIPGEDVFDMQLGQAAKSFQTISSLFLDLDNFKSVNDDYDHSVGDQVIREAISIIQKVMAGKGELFHRSGDEMLVLLNNFSESEACSVAERIRLEIEAAEFPAIGSGMVTATIGVSTYPKPCADWQQLQVTADQAAMSAKKLGKNQVLHYSERQQASEPSRETTLQTKLAPKISDDLFAETRAHTDVDFASSSKSVEALAEVLLNMLQGRSSSSGSSHEIEKLRKIYKLEREINQLKSEVKLQDES